MRQLRQFCALLMLCAVLTVPALAGDISCGYADNPPPPPPQAAGDILQPIVEAVAVAVLSLS